MSKWFEEIDSKNSNVIYSRVRLARNWDEYPGIFLRYLPGVL